MLEKIDYSLIISKKVFMKN